MPGATAPSLSYIAESNDFTLMTCSETYCDMITPASWTDEGDALALQNAAAVAGL
jgi:hypothetical protein